MFVYFFNPLNPRSTTVIYQKKKILTIGIKSHLFLFFVAIKSLLLNCVIFICLKNKTCFNGVLFPWRLS
jgi:hypothetical protein